MAEEIVNLDTPNEEPGEVVVADDADATALKEKLTELNEKNRQLFARAKKAEGFELKDGHWVKSEPKVEKVKKEEKKEEKTEGLGYAEKAYLKASGVQERDEFDLFESELGKYREGTPLDMVLESQDFKNKLTSLREKKKVEDATPESSPRSSSTSKNKVDYWLNRDDLPEDTAANRKLREDIVDARIAREKGPRGTI